MKKRPFIVVADDDQQMLKLLSRVLELEGFDVAVVTDGRLALRLLEERRPDLLILDIIMPGLSGFEVLDLVRQRSDIPVIMLTVIADVDSLRQALAAGADDYVTKPFSPRELVARIRAKLRRAGSAGDTIYATKQPAG